MQIILETFEEGLICGLPEFKCVSNGRYDQLGIADGSEFHEEDTISKVIQQVGRDLQTDTRFADTACTCEGQEAHLGASEQSIGCCYLLLAPN